MGSVSWQLPRQWYTHGMIWKHCNIRIFCTLCLLVVQIRNSHLTIEVEPERMLVVSRRIIIPFEDCFQPPNEPRIVLQVETPTEDASVEAHMRSYCNFPCASFTLKFQQNDNITMCISYMHKKWQYFQSINGFSLS